MKTLLLKTITRFLLDNKIHFIAWSIFIFYETIILGFVNGFGTAGNYIVHYSYNIFIFYLHAHYLLPFILKSKKRIWWRLPLLVVEVLIFSGIIFLLDLLIMRYTSILTFEMNKEMFYRICYRTVFFIGFSSGYYSLLTFLKERELNVELEKQYLIGIIKQQDTQNELNITINAYLKAQINPHFLFNTLNFIYNNTRKTAPVAAEAIMTLSEMMRYAIRSENAGAYISLYTEIEQLENLIHLHQLRQNNTLQISFDHGGVTKEIKFIPLVLMTLAENMFKHGNLSKVSKPASITIDVKDNQLLIRTRNLINDLKDLSGENIGLDNVHKRLLHTYGDAAVFSYFTDNEGMFQVDIIVNLV